jgi:hypothetical protein
LARDLIKGFGGSYTTKNFAAPVTDGHDGTLIKFV